MSIADQLVIGSSFSLRSFGRVRDGLSACNMVRLGSSLSIRSFHRLGSSLSVTGSLLTNGISIGACYIHAQSATTMEIRGGTKAIVQFDFNSGAKGTLHGTWSADTPSTLTSDRNLKIGIRPLWKELLDNASPSTMKF